MTGVEICIVLVCFSSLVAIVFKWRLGRSRVRSAVFHDLDSAYSNGYFTQDGYLNGMSPYEIAYDLTCYSADFDYKRTKPHKLVPHVRVWLYQKGLLR